MASRSPELTFIGGGGVLSADGSRVVPSDVLLAGERIDAVAPNLQRPDSARVVDAGGCLVLPGLVNAHTHSHNNLSRGLVGEWTLEDFLNHGPALLSARTPDELHLAALLGAVEMLKRGCTAAYDLTTSIPGPTEEAMDAVADGYAAAGIRVLLAPMMLDLPFLHTIPDLLDTLPAELRKSVSALTAKPAQELLGVAERFYKRHHGSAGGRLQVAIAPSIPVGCSDEFLEGCVRLQSELGVSIHCHLEETKVQAVQGRRRWGTTTTRHLAAIGALGPRFAAAHAVWVDADDLALLADTGSGIAHNPASNLRIGSGIAPIREALDAGVKVGLGTDGSAASDSLDMYTAMRFAAMVSRVRFGYEQGRWLGSRDAFRMATTGSSALLGAEGLGRLEPGATADVVLMKLDSVGLAPVNDALNAVVFRESGACVDTVFVGGKKVVQGGTVLDVDEARLRDRAQAAAESILERNQAWWRLAAAVTPYLSAACGRLAATEIGVDRYA